MTKITGAEKTLNKTGVHTDSAIYGMNPPHISETWEHKAGGSGISPFIYVPGTHYEYS